MEESGSEGLDVFSASTFTIAIIPTLQAILRKHKDTFLADVDFTCISDNYWLGKKKPCITYGLRFHLFAFSVPK